MYSPYLFDLDGTIYVGDTFLPGVAETLTALRKAGRRTIFLSNNPTKTRSQYMTKLGIPTPIDDIITSSFVMVQWLLNEMPQARLFVVGQVPLKQDLHAAGFQFSETAGEIEMVVASFLPTELECLHHFLTKGLTATAALWPHVQAGYAWVHRAAHLLTNAEQQAAKEVQQNYQSLLDEMRQEVCTSEPLRKMIATFLKVTDSYRPGLFFCYVVPDLPRTNNDLEHLFGSTRYHERRATGRKQASPGLVVRRAVRIVASVASQRYHFKGPELQPFNLTQWRALRHQVESRHEARREQYRFRKAPAEYLVALEEKLSQQTMRS